MKTDARVRYTRRVIRDSFVGLLRDKPLNKITVKEICDAAEINRATFYKHYQDVYDLIEKLEDEALAELDAKLHSIEVEGIHGMLVSILKTLRDLQLPYDALAADGHDNRFIMRMMGHCLNYLAPSLGGELPAPATEQQRNMLYAFLVGGSVGMIECWQRGGAAESPEAIACQIEWLTGATSAGLKAVPGPQ